MKTTPKNRVTLVPLLFALVLPLAPKVNASGPLATNYTDGSLTGVSTLTGTLAVFFRSETPSNFSQRTLTFAERVAYQRAIEEVYWRHRIWPKERSDPKPALDAVMSQPQIEEKVQDYLRDSQTVEAYWQNPITPDQLQAEMERMARDTKQPGVLQELFEALGNDPFVIAECLARPLLADAWSPSYRPTTKTSVFPCWVPKILAASLVSQRQAKLFIFFRRLIRAPVTPGHPLAPLIYPPRAVNTRRCGRAAR